MPFRPEIAGRMDAGKRKRAEKWIDRRREKGSRPKEDETEKTAEQESDIGLVNDLLGEELARFGVGTFEPIKPEQVHLLPRENFVRKIKEKGEGVEWDTYAYNGTAYPLERSVQVNKAALEDAEEGAENWEYWGDSFSDRVNETATDAYFEAHPGEDWDNMNEEEFERWTDAKYDELFKRWQDKLIAREVRYRFLHIQMHETIHLAAFHKVVFDPDKKKVTRLIQRGGYDIFRESGKEAEEQQQYLRAFNEAIVERATIEILTKNTARIDQQDDPDFKAIEESGAIKDWYPGSKDVQRYLWLNGAYAEFRGILDAVIAGISEQTEEPPERIWETLKKGHFTGSMMHLRAIEQAFGPGSLRVLANIGDANTKAAKAYFTEKRPEEREKLAMEILKDEPEELERWRRRSGGGAEAA